MTTRDIGQMNLSGGEVEKPKAHLVMPKVLGTNFEIPENYEGKPVTAEEGEFFSNNGCSPFDKCKGCDELLIDIYRANICDNGRYHIEEGYYSDKVDGFVCGMCREGDHEPGKGTVVLYNPAEKNVTKYFVGHYSDELWCTDWPVDIEDLENINFEPEGESEDCPIDFSWYGMGYRGYYTPNLPEGWLHVHEDSILGGSEDAGELEMFDRDIKKLLWEAGMEFALLFETTSNVCSTGYDVVAKCTPDELKMVGVLSQVQALQEKYRDRSRFMRTALTGSSEDSKEGNLMVEAYDMIRAGASARDVIKKLAPEVAEQ